MSNLKEIAELSHSQIFPKSGGKAPIDVQEFIRTSINEWAYLTWLAFLNEKNLEGYAEAPSYLLAETDIDIVNNEMDISILKTFKSIPQDQWLVNIGGMNCECKYVKSTANLTQLLCSDDSLPDDTKTYYITGKKIKFPQGTHKNTLPILYASMGDDSHKNVEVDEAIGSQIRDKLNAMYLGRVPPTDVTNNNNPNQP